MEDLRRTNTAPWNGTIFVNSRAALIFYLNCTKSAHPRLHVPSYSLMQRSFLWCNAPHLKSSMSLKLSPFPFVFQLDLVTDFCFLIRFLCSPSPLIWQCDLQLLHWLSQRHFPLFHIQSFPMLVQALTLHVLSHNFYHDINHLTAVGHFLYWSWRSCSSFATT